MTARHYTFAFLAVVAVAIFALRIVGENQASVLIEPTTDLHSSSSSPNDGDHIDVHRGSAEEQPTDRIPPKRERDGVDPMMISATSLEVLTHIDQWGRDSSVETFLLDKDHSQVIQALNADLASRIASERLDRTARAIVFVLQSIGDTESHELVAELLTVRTPSLTDSTSMSSRTDVVLAKAFAIRALENMTSRSPTGELVQRFESSMRFVVESEESAHVVALAAHGLIGRSPTPTAELDWFLERADDSAVDALFAQRINEL